ncbi:hypothetical protein ACFVSX_16350 [Streptomyces rubiginosohelvolus]|uniref:hypothetical protein n=1 Tax=Streptomyces rubiginosohelvolus TaxID=67362 RepID=UPI0036D7929F
MTTHPTTAAANTAPLISAHAAADALVLVGRPLREDAGPSPRFGDDVWKMAAAYHLPNHHKGQSTIIFTTVEDPIWRLTAKEYAYSRLTKITEGCKRLPSVVTVCREFREFRKLFVFLAERHPGLRLRDLVDDTVLDAFLDERVAGIKPELQPQERGRVKWFLTLLFRTRESITFDQLERLPWTGRASKHVAGIRPPENMTRRIPPQVLAPYLRGALFYVRIASKDILAALAEQERINEPVGDANKGHRGTGQALLEAFIERRRQEGRGMPARPADINLPHKYTPASDRRVNRTLIAKLARVGDNTVDHPANLELLRQAAAELGLEEGGMDTEISIDEETGRPWRPRFHSKSLLIDTRMLLTACYVITAYLSGMRDSEAQSLKPGCHFTTASEDGIIERHKLRGKVFKGRQSVGDEDTWVVIEPVAEAVAVMESLTDCDRLFYRHGYRRDNDGVGTTINHLLNVFADRLAEVRPHDPIPLVDGEKWRFTTRQFRRTVAWHIAFQPFGVVAGKIQYKHVKVAMFEGYAGSSASGFPSEVEGEQRLARTEHFLDQYEDFKAGVRMPPRLAEQFARIRDELGDFPGRVVDPARLRAMLTNPARTYYPGVLNDCYFEPSTALCLSRRPSAEPEAAPVMNHCQPAKCPNSCVLPQHRPAIDSVIDDTRKLLTIRPMTSLQKAAVHQQIEQLKHMRDQTEETAR